MNDLISRRELIAQLDAIKAASGDPVIKLIFAKMIEMVERQPKVEG